LPLDSFFCNTPLWWFFTTQSTKVDCVLPLRIYSQILKGVVIIITRISVEMLKCDIVKQGSSHVVLKHWYSRNFICTFGNWNLNHHHDHHIMHNITKVRRLFQSWELIQTTTLDELL
jgi:hypothetical protein